MDKKDIFEIIFFIGMFIIFTSETIQKDIIDVVFWGVTLILFVIITKRQ